MAVLEMLPPIDHAPVPVMSIELAHKIMQRHIDCLVTVCRVKHQAKMRLIEAGALVPADQPHC